MDIFKNIKKKWDKLDDNEKYALIIVGIIALIISIFLLVFQLNAYKKPLKNIFKGVNKSDVEIVMESIYPDETMTAKKVNARDDGFSWEDYINKKNNSVSDTLNNMELKKVKYKIVDSEEVSGSDMLDEIKAYYNDKYELKVKKAYRIKVDITFKTNSGEQNFTDMLYVAKLKGEGWKFYPEEYNKITLDYIDVVINAALE